MIIRQDHRLFVSGQKIKSAPRQSGKAFRPASHGGLGAGGAAGAFAQARARSWFGGTFAGIIDMARGSAMVNVAERVEKGIIKRGACDHHLDWMMQSGGVEVVLKRLERGHIHFAPGFH